MAPTKNSKNESKPNTATGASPPSSPAKANTSSNVPSTPTKANTSPKKSFSPTRKVNGFVRVTTNARQDFYELGFIDLSMGPVFGMIINKEKGKGVAFNAPNFRILMELPPEQLDDIGFLGLYNIRDPNDADKPKVVTNIKMKEYNEDFVLMTCENIIKDGEEATERDYFLMVTKFAAVFNRISKQAEAAGEFKYGAPLYVNKGNMTPLSGACLFDYLMTFDCVKVMKQFCAGIDTKTELMIHNDRDDILEVMFGDSQKGFELVSAIDEMIYTTL